MRVIGYLDSPAGQKITVFKHEAKLILKFEEGLYELSYKFRQNEALQDLADLEKLVDTDFRQAVSRHFAAMRQEVEQATGRYLSQREGWTPPQYEEEELI